MAPRPSNSSTRLEQAQQPTDQTQPATWTSKKMTRRTFMKYSIGAAVGIPLLSGAYAKWVEPYQLRRRTLTIASERIPSSFDGVTIAHLSDLHYGEFVTKEHVVNIFEQIMANKPDMVCFTGDLVEDHVMPAETIIEVMRKLQAPLGKYAVLGNHDYVRDSRAYFSSDRTDLVTASLEASGFRVLTNKHHQIHYKDSSIAVAGIDDALEGNPDMETALQGCPPNLWCLLLAHEPDWADIASRYPIDLQLSGHSHGGQVRVPIVGPLMLPLMAKKYPDGMYQISRKQARTSEIPELQLHTSRGVGMTLMPIRFFCPPEWTLITLRSVTKSSTS
ncbi:metallophosphoesterase [Paenibacillus assamensis]|uniref:metallophosphoesterase n=1 Tax=Paenibacillus assamensis TaxID=311244 RepID=UPI000416B56D|nr:metallophosphoesterase [Paenibacillus assamensis]